MASMSILEFLKIKGGKFKLLLGKINFKNFPNTKLFGKRFPNTKPFGKHFPNGLVFGKKNFPNSLVFGKNCFQHCRGQMNLFVAQYSAQIRNIRVPENMVRILE